MLDTNPTLIQPAPPGQISRTPLVLIHDGSGLISSYFWLGPLGRQVFGIFNPHFELGGNWESGLPSMAKTYSRLIKSVVSHGKILLGGWSLGGLLSLEIARCLAQDADVTVVGLVMIDSPYPKANVTNVANICDDYVAPHVTNAEFHLKLQQNTQHARQMIRDWAPPSWRNGMLLEDVEETVQDEVSGKATISSKQVSLPSSPPPGILLKAVDCVPVQDSELNSIDVSRNTKHLGWKEYEYNFIRVVFDIPGHHYNVFASDKVKQLTTKISMACAVLDARS